MSYRELNLKRSYVTTNNGISSVVRKLIENSTSYDRSVGYFSIDVISIIGDQLLKIKEKNGRIRLITSPNLSPDDLSKLNTIYDKKEQFLKEKLDFQITEYISSLDDTKLKIMTELVLNDTFQIKIVSKKGVGFYHDKLAIFTNELGEKVVIVGSSNETLSGYVYNYEKIRLYESYDNVESVNEEIEEFESIWENKNFELDVYEYKSGLITLLENEGKKRSKLLRLRPYQEDAINKFINNGFKGFYVMATGTGKTVTTAFTIKKYIEEKGPSLVVIAVPYIHLISQWKDTIDKVIFNCDVQLVAGSIIDWDKKLSDYLMAIKYVKPRRTTIVISTILSFISPRFEFVFKHNIENKFLIVDEAHNFFNNINNSKINDFFGNKLGLSATPTFGKDIEKTKRLVNYFGGVVYELPIDEAIGKFLVNYKYHPIFVRPTEDEEKAFKDQSARMASCFKKNVLVDKEKFNKAYRQRLRIISMLDSKLNDIDNYIKEINPDNHFIVYCSDGKLSDYLKHLPFIVSKLDMLDYKVGKFTASENRDERDRLISMFDVGDIDGLVAIRCLDEGIDIPSIKTAIILSSNDNFREFVQRRGRILRRIEGKDYANIYDLIALPSTDSIEMAKIELRRYYEYARLALNKDVLIKDINQKLDKYGIDIEIIKQSEIDYEVEIDE